MKNNKNFFTKNRIYMLIGNFSLWFIGEIVVIKWIEPFILSASFPTMFKNFISDLWWIILIFSGVIFIGLIIYWKVKDYFTRLHDLLKKAYLRIKFLELINKSYGKTEIFTKDAYNEFSEEDLKYIEKIYRSLDIDILNPDRYFKK